MQNAGPLTVLVLAIAMASCGRQPAPEPGAPKDGASSLDTSAAAPDPAMEQTSECINDSLGYAVRYPADWHRNTEDILGPCSLFDPEPIEIIAGSEIPVEIAIAIDFEAVPFAAVTGEVHGRRTLSREGTTIDGREAMQIRGETTGEGLHERGIGTYQYFTALGDTTVIATTYSAGPIPFDRKRRILDAMMDTFEFRRDR